MALVKDHELDAGATWEWGFVYAQATVVSGETVPGDPYDLTGCEARMQLRAKITDSTPLISLHTNDGGIEITGPSGRVDIVLTDEQTALIAATKPGKAVTVVYDLELVWPAAGGARPKVTRLVQGKLTVRPGVTRDNDIPPDGVDDE